MTRRQIARLRERLCHVPPQITRIVVTHHPLDLPEAYQDRELAWRARDAMETLVACEADVLLSGHLHASHACGATERPSVDAPTRTRGSGGWSPDLRKGPKQDSRLGRREDEA